MQFHAAAWLTLDKADIFVMNHNAENLYIIDKTDGSIDTAITGLDQCWSPSISPSFSSDALNILVQH